MLRLTVSSETATTPIARFLDYQMESEAARSSPHAPAVGSADGAWISTTAPTDS